ncbi:hypothetical protein CYLTODRAFT_335836, partial [Cylindrobasidium torrendii FP15055 ss-10]
LDRSLALGGGARSVTFYARKNYKTSDYSSLSPARKERIKSEQRNDWKWRNDNLADRIFSTECMKEVRVDGVADAPLLCVACSGVASSKPFKNALSIRRPLNKNYKFSRHDLRQDNLMKINARCSGLEELMD